LIEIKARLTAIAHSCHTCGNGVNMCLSRVAARMGGTRAAFYVLLCLANADPRTFP
jgi:hypothetical protein